MPEVALPPAKDAMLSHGAHEVRNPVAVIIGYVRMLTSERLGPIAESQRKVLGEISVSAARLAALAEQMSLLAQMVAGGVTFAAVRVDLGALIEAAMPAVAALPDRTVTLRLANEAGGVVITGDPARLREAFQALIFAHRREVAASDELSSVIERATLDGRPAVRITIAGADQIVQLRQLAPSDLAPFVEFRGGIGYSLAIVRQVVLAHGGQIFSRIDSPKNPSSAPVVHGAVVLLPEA
jgi:signal transduction histidine kinase